MFKFTQMHVSISMYIPCKVSKTKNVKTKYSQTKFEILQIESVVFNTVISKCKKKITIIILE